MLTILILISVLVISLILFTAASRTRNEGLQIFYVLVGLLFMAFCVFDFIAIPMEQLGGRKFVQEFKETDATYRRARENADIENAAIQTDIANMNRKLAVKKYWNSNWFCDIFIYDGVEDLEPIE